MSYRSGSCRASPPRHSECVNGPTWDRVLEGEQHWCTCACHDAQRAAIATLDAQGLSRKEIARLMRWQFYHERGGVGSEVDAHDPPFQRLKRYLRRQLGRSEEGDV